MARPKKTKNYLKSFKEFLGTDLSGKTLTILSHPSFTPQTIKIFAETKFTLITKINNRYIMIPKTRNSIFRISIGGKSIKFSGHYLIGTPRIRRKRRLRRW